LEKIESNEGKMSLLSAWCGEYWFILRLHQVKFGDNVHTSTLPDNFPHFMSVVRKLWTPERSCKSYWESQKCCLF